jgi:hypothetical protein
MLEVVDHLIQMIRLISSLVQRRKKGTFDVFKQMFTKNAFKGKSELIYDESDEIIEDKDGLASRVITKVGRQTDKVAYATKGVVDGVKHKAEEVRDTVKGANKDAEDLERLI